MDRLWGSDPSACVEFPLLQGRILCVMWLDKRPDPASCSPVTRLNPPQRWAVSLDMAAARLHSSSSTLKRQSAEAGGRAAELEAQAASLSARQQELEGLSRELNKDRGLLEQLAGQLEVGRHAESKHSSMPCGTTRDYCTNTYSSNRAPPKKAVQVKFCWQSHILASSFLPHRYRWQGRYHGVDGSSGVAVVITVGCASPCVLSCW